MSYTILSLLGQGSFGKVYKVKIGNFGEFALKYVDLRGDRKQLIEAFTMSIVGHPHLMDILGLQCVESREMYILMNYCSGGSLRNKIRSLRTGRFSEEQSLKWFAQIADGLKHLHRYQIWHRDLKPDNIMLDEGDNIKIADFGLAKYTRGEDFNTAVLGSQVGTPIYMSPEILLHTEYNEKTDIWSLGCIYYEILTTRLAFSDYRTCLQRPLPLPVLPDSTRPQIRTLIYSMLEVDHARRPSAEVVFNKVVEIQGRPYVNMPHNEISGLNVDWNVLIPKVRSYRH